MNYLFNLISLAVLASLVVALVLAWAHGFLRPRRNARVKSLLTVAFHAPVGFLGAFTGHDPVALANIAEGTHAGMITKLSDAAAGRNLIYKIGSDADHIAVAGVGDIPLGVSDDESGAAEESINLLLLGSIKRTLLIQTTAAAITQGDYVVPGASGQARKLPVASGTYYIIGRALNTTAGNSGDLVEVDPCVPVQRVVP